ncbi:MAG: phosphoglycerate mutase family protein [Firmicutes bacterium]|nr:phosphoglycerate mutase family protein [Bacillota bacterium]
MKSYIHFIRHGITEGNAKKWYYGWTDVPLLPEGVAALQNLCAQGIYPPLLDADCYTSGMVRTEQTFQVIYGDAPHRALPHMKEINFGDWERLTFEELKSDPHFDTWINDKTGTVAYPGGESLSTFAVRIGQGLTELLALHHLKELSHSADNQDAVSILVCHGGVIAASMENMFPNEKETFWQWVPDPGHGYTVYLKDGKPESYEPI